MNDRSWVKTNTSDFTFSNSIFKGDGVVYVNATGLSLTSGSQITAKNYIGLDVGLLTVNASTITLASNFSSLYGGSPLAPQGGLVQ